MFEFIKNKLHAATLFFKARITPRQKDTALLLGLLIAGGATLFYFPSFFLFATYSFVLLNIPNVLLYFFTGATFVTLINDRTNTGLLSKLRQNELSIIELKWLLLPGLFTKGADPNGISNHVSPLAEAAIHGRKDLIEVLIAKGAKIDKQCSRSPLREAIVNNHTDLIDLLFYKQFNFDHDFLLCTPIIHGNFALFHKLITLEADKNLSNFNKYNLMRNAIEHNQIKILKAYREEFKTHFVKTDDAEISLIFASMSSDNFECFAYLLKNTRKELLDREGSILMSHAHTCHSQKYVDALKSKGCKLNPALGPSLLSQIHLHKQQYQKQHRDTQNQPNVEQPQQANRASACRA